MDISYDISFSPTRIIHLELENRVIIPLFEFAKVRVHAGSPEHQKILDGDLTRAQTIDSQCLRRNIPTVCYNCHGLVFATRRGWLNDADQVLANEGSSYLELSDFDSVHSGDIICYYKNSSITHTGIVVDLRDLSLVQLSGTPVRVLSKWGAGGEYVHDHDKSPYGVVFKIFRYVKAVH
jgi:hypothetical protein